MGEIGMEIDEIISVVPYDEKWTTLFQNEKVDLLKAFGIESFWRRCY